MGTKGWRPELPGPGGGRGRRALLEEGPCLPPENTQLHVKALWMTQGSH